MLFLLLITATATIGTGFFVVRRRRKAQSAAIR